MSTHSRIVSLVTFRRRLGHFCESPALGGRTKREAIYSVRGDHFMWFLPRQSVPLGVFLVKEAVAAAKLDIDLYFFSDGDEILQFLAQIDEDSVQCPELLLLDLNIPKRDGFQVLSYLRGSKRCASMRVIVMTSSSVRADREKSASLKVDSYFNKPGTYAEFLTLGDVIRGLI